MALTTKHYAIALLGGCALGVLIPVVQAFNEAASARFEKGTMSIKEEGFRRVGNTVVNILDGDPFKPNNP